MLLSLLEILAEYFVVNTLVNLQYEPDLPNECVSQVSGTNLCVWLSVFKMATILCFSGSAIFFVIAFMKRSSLY
jgi:hypothetical protein